MRSSSPDAATLPECGLPKGVRAVFFSQFILCKCLFCGAVFRGSEEDGELFNTKTRLSSLSQRFLHLIGLI